MAGLLLQRVVNAVRSAASHEGPLSLERVRPIIKLVDEMLPEHVGLAVPSASEAASKYPNVSYIDVVQHPNFSIGIFILPPNGSIPLHDHPGMCVISRVLYGSLKVKSFDVVDDNIHGAGDNRAPRTVVARKAEVVEAPSTDVLTASVGNIHEFQAGPDVGAAVFDILMPPYDPYNGRDCTYYSIREDSRRDISQLEGGAVTGEKLSLDLVYPDFVVDMVDYTGPLLQPLDE